MRLLASTDIALRVIMLLGGQDNAYGQLKVETIARELGDLSRNHLHKIVQSLSALGVVRTTRGARGGVTLTDEAGEMRLGELIRKLEADQALVECFRPNGNSCSLLSSCRLIGILYEAQESFYRSLNRTRLSDLVDGGMIHA